ncbi:MAG: ATP-grasp domain-containing protein [Candidatus Muiribacteriota bacterium]
MNYVYISPHFPQHYINFSKQLSEHGVNVLSITDLHDWQLPQNLKNYIKGNYRVSSFSNNAEVVNACYFYQKHFGKIDFVESHLEPWLWIEARIRSEFNIPGIKIFEIEKFIKKSKMKENFKKANVKTAPGEITTSIFTSMEFCRKHGYPVIIKPDIGVGAVDTHKIDNEKQLVEFHNNFNPHTTYFIEKFIFGTIETFDGLSDLNSNPVFSTSLHYPGTLQMKTCSKNYYLTQKMPADLYEKGKRVIKEFGLKNKFFHVEFFRTEENELYGLELNARPPGGFTTDMINFSADHDIYRDYAELIVNKKISSDFKVKYYTGFIAREDWKTYIHSELDIFSNFRNNVVFSGRMPDIFAGLMGNHGYIIRADSLEKLNEIFSFIDKSI